MQLSRKKKTIIIVAAVVGLTLIVILSTVLQRKEGEPVQTGKVERRTVLESKVTASGEIRPVKFYNLTAEVPGRVEKIYVNEGDPVKKGQPLVEVDATQTSFAVSGAKASVEIAQKDVENLNVAVQQAQNNINQMKAMLAAAQADLERNKADLKLAESEFNRHQQLVEEGIITKSQFDSVKSRHEQAIAVVNAQKARIDQLNVQVRDAELGVDRARSSLASAQERVKQGQAQLNQQMDQFNKTTRLSPIDGVVSSLPVKVGEYALASFSSTPLLTVADMSQINAEIQVDETDIADVQVGQKTKVKVDALGSIEIDGEVIEKGASAITRSGQAITSSSTSSQEAKDFLVKIKLNPTEEIRIKLRPGMSATAVITTATVQNPLTVPLQAIVPRELPKEGEEKKEEDSASPGRKREVEGVFLFDNGRARFKQIETGIKGDQDIVVTSGLNEGDEIIIGPYKSLRALKDDDQVKKEAKSANSNSR